MTKSARMKRSADPGFTLVELLVSMTVLTLLIVMIGQLVSSAATTINRSGKHMDSDTDSRLLFNRMALDLGHMLKRGDVDYSTFKQPSGSLVAPYASTTIQKNPQGGDPSASNGLNDGLAFYSETDGYYSGAGAPPSGSDKAPVSLVAYMVDTDPPTKTTANPTGAPALRRLGKGLGWDPAAGWTPGSPNQGWGSIALLPLTILGQWSDLFHSDQNAQAVDADYQTVSSQVVRFEYTYLLKPNFTDSSGNVYASKLSTTPYFSDQNNMASSTLQAHQSINGFKDVAAIVVAVVMLDPTSRVIVRGTDGYQNLANVFPDAVDSSTDSQYNGDISAAWNGVINANPPITVNGVPKPALSSLRVYERYFYLNATP